MPALAEPQRLRLTGTPVISCAFEGWSNDLDETGLPVRAAPDRYATVIARLPPPVVLGLDEIAVVVSVTGYSDGWFRIDEAAFPTSARGTGAPRREVFRGSGWVPAPTIKAQLAARSLRARPDARAPQVAALSGRRQSGGSSFAFGPDGVGVRRLLACQGTWVEAETELGRGWVERVCAEQLETCPAR
jgi:SH3-like domain-containing protein